MFYNLLEHMFEEANMLQKVSIKNYALIKNIDIDLVMGLNVLTGETGAGKSMILSAINFALGSKADKSCIMNGATQTKVELVFGDNNEMLYSKLMEMGIVFEQNDDCLIVNRILSLDGKNEIHINGQNANISMLKELASILVDWCGQHEHQILLNSKHHINLIDNYIGDDLFALKSALSLQIQELTKIKNDIKKLCGNDLDIQRNYDLLKYQIEELEQANLIEGEDIELIEQRRKYQNSQRIVEGLSEIVTLLDGNEDGGMVNAINNARHNLSTLSTFENKCANLSERLLGIKIELVDIIEQLKDLLLDYNFDENDFNRINDRLDIIKSLGRKYGGSVHEMLEYLGNAKRQLDEFEGREELLTNLNKKKINLEEEIHNTCEAISKKRKEKSSIMTKHIVKELQELGMTNAVFDIKFGVTDPTATGKDSVEFYFSANSGCESKPLSKVISGGEMSRLMLAFKIVFGETFHTNTMIFDEIDSGVSGGIAQIVAQKLKKLAVSNQIIVITHLPVIAASADKHYFIEKVDNGETTTTTLRTLQENECLNEIARLAGGQKGSQAALAHAMEMRELSKKHASL